MKQFEKVNNAIHEIGSINWGSKKAVGQEEESKALSKTREV